MLGADVPCIPGYHGSNQDPNFLQDQAAEIGYPVLLKAVHGGGGKGMRIAQSPDTFAAQLSSAKSEAQNSFGDATMLVEKYITRPRHVEVQVFGDKHGNAVALGERDCSIQRRHQKIIEESPAPNLSTEQRRELWGRAIEAARAVNYVGAGTVEFILDADTGKFYFMEMNTRLQVEHPVTEMCTGLDLVEWQLRIARGERLPLSQVQIEDRIATRGHALEARIYAEDPRVDFLPTAGTLTHLRLPEEQSDSIRIDTAIRRAPTTISSHYDPMISKLIVRGPDRVTALKKMKIALQEYEVAGLATNIEFLKELCSNGEFITAGDALETGFIPKHKDKLFPPRDVPAEVWAQAALGLVLAEVQDNVTPLIPASSLGFRPRGVDLPSLQPRIVHLTEVQSPTASANDSTATIQIQPISPSSFSLSVEMTRSEASLQPKVFSDVSATVTSISSNARSISAIFPDTRLNSTMVLPLDSEPLQIEKSITLFDRGQRYDLKISPPAWLTKALGKTPASADEASVAAPMPSKILRVEVSPGDTVTKDQALVVVESMKMEMLIRSPKDGLIVKKVAFRPGVSFLASSIILIFSGLLYAQEICKAGAVLVEFEDTTLDS